MDLIKEMGMTKIRKRLQIKLIWIGLDKQLFLILFSLIFTGSILKLLNDLLLVSGETG